METKNLDLVRERIKNRPWFRSSRESTKEKLLALGEDCLGFLEDLAARPNEIGGVRVISLEDILIPDVRPIFGIFAYFKVMTIATGVVYHYQYFSWAKGPTSGSKGIVLVEDDKGGVTHVILQRGEKFATGKPVYDCFGGFGDGISGSEDKLISLFKKELAEELGSQEIKPKRIITLGRLMMDSGMTNNHPYLFAMVVSAEAGAEISEGMKNNPDPFELRTGVVIVPIAKLKEAIREIDDTYFLACLLRFMAAEGKNLL